MKERVIERVKSPYMDEKFKETERNLQNTKLEMDRYTQELERSGNIRTYTDENGFNVREIISKDGSMKVITKSRITCDSEYDSRLTIWQNGEKICDKVQKSQIEPMNKNSRNVNPSLSTGGFLSIVFIGMIIIIIVIIVFKLFA